MIGHSACASRRGQQMHLQSEAVGGGRLALDLDQPLRIAGQAQATVALPTRGLPGLLFQPVVQLDAVLEKLRHVRGRAQLADQAGGMPGRATRELGALEQDDVLEACARQMVSRTAADDAAADDDDLRSRGRRGHGVVPEYLSTLGELVVGAAEARQVVRWCKRRSRTGSSSGPRTPCSTWSRAAAKRISSPRIAAPGRDPPRRSSAPARTGLDPRRARCWKPGRRDRTAGC